MDVINNLKNIYTDQAYIYEEFENLYNKRLWHQLSLVLINFLDNKSNKRDNNFYELYKGFISLFSNKLNPLQFVTIVSIVGHSFNDHLESLTYFEDLIKSNTTLSEEAKICLQMDIVIVLLKLGKLIDAQNQLESSGDTLFKLQSIDSLVFSKYYKSLSECYKLKGPAHEYHKAALMYITYTNIDKLSTEEKYELATDIALAAISGEGIYNFGEVIATPILKYLLNTSNAWLYDLIYALNNGDVDTFNKTIELNKSVYFNSPALVSQHESIKQKVVLLSLINIAFERSPNDRIISFEAISQRCKCTLDQVEWILMRALSLGLIKGKIDEVSNTVQITWVQPRVLDMQQLQLLHQQVGSWTEKVKQSLITIEDQTTELFA